MKVGFIVEGKTEKIIVESAAFRNYLKSKNITLCDPVIDANGNGNLLPRYLVNHIEALKQANSDMDQIVVLTDLEQEISVDDVVNRISCNEIHDELIFVSVKAIESWFLAHTESLSKALGSAVDVYIENPESDPDFPQILPWDLIKKIAKDNSLRGPGRLKTLFAKKMISHGFDVIDCLNHPNLNSVKFLDRKLGKINSFQRKF